MRDARPTTRRGRRFYTPTPINADMPGVAKDECSSFDMYSGWQDALVAAGLLPAHLFPGEPGTPLSSLTLYPQGVEVADACWRTPGVMSVSRHLDGAFEAHIQRSVEDSARRAAAC